MKNTFKLATISALVMLSANVMAEDATQDFTWAGTVPAAGATDGIKVIRTGATEFDAGVFTLSNPEVYGTSGDYLWYDIASPNTLSFDVVTDNASEDHVDYYYTLTSFAYSRRALDSLKEVTKNQAQNAWDLIANGATLEKEVKTTVPATAPTNLSIGGRGIYVPGEEHTFQATLLITDLAI
ncbi:hypothetical protein Sps_03954 [Shewanella psychrophila]|uniref:Uncharacterized protein n=1 Tax=Shewanella psychrophila TaxID=225848 RepID=A0A1S6HUB0_9GAMM|nr:hypothetical protein [Shewanella psychrophila]AQS39069.1 hypothetical protein Sps_03954 [Shewanella psychrophila]